MLCGDVIDCGRRRAPGCVVYMMICVCVERVWICLAWSYEIWLAVNGEWSIIRRVE